MVFRFYSNTISQASRAFAMWIFIAGMILIGFGLLIFVFPEFFATLAAMFFWVIGAVCAITAVKIFLTTKTRNNINPSDGYRKNVHVRIEDRNEF